MNLYSLNTTKLMNNPFQQQLIEARQNHILDAAIEVISKNGFQRTTIKQIAKQAGIADGTIYNYFKNKEAILMGIIARLSETELSDIQTAETEEIDFETFTRSFVSQRMQEIDDDFQALKVIMAETITNEALSLEINETLYAPGFAIAEQYFQHLIDQGEMAESDPVTLVRLFSAPLFGLMFLRLIGDEHTNQNWHSYTQVLIQSMLKTYQ